MSLLGPAAVGFQPEWWDVLQAPFMRNAFLGGTLVALLAGVVGYFVVVRTSSFAAHALAHIGFPGATGAVLLGLPVTLGLAVFCTVGAVAIGALGRRVSEREIATGTILALATGLGVLFASLSTRSTGVVTSVLFGNLLAISAGQLAVFAGFTLVVLVTLAVVFRPLLFASVDLEVAEARAVPVRALGVLFLVLLALTVTMAVQVVGTLLLFALVVTPAATALRWTARPGRAILSATAVSLLSVWSGLVVAAVLDLPPSFVIVTVAFLVWFGTWCADRRGHQVGDPRPSVDHHHPG